jgi:hypothetical protein
MSALSVSSPYPIFTDIDGQPLEAGYVWIGTANLDPQTNPINVYWDAALTIPAPQPIRTLGGYPARNGTPARLYVNSNYSILVMNKNGSTVYSAPAATERYSEVVVQTNAEQVVYNPPFTGGVATNVEAKLSESVSVFDFMTPAQIADVQARTFLVDTIDAIDAAIAAAPAIYFPPGGYLVSRAIALTGNSLNGKTLYGSTLFNTTIKRLTTNSQVIGGNTVSCVMSVGGLDHNISNYDVGGEANTNVIDGVYLDCARTTISDVRANWVRKGFLAKQPYLCIFNRLWAKDASDTAFDFSSPVGKTSLIFNNCICENVGNAYLLTFAYYSVMNSCVADYANYTATGNPYGRGYGSRASPNAIFQFNGGDIVMNGCGTENSYGNGFVGFALDQSTNVTANNCTAFVFASTYDPTATRGADWAVGPFQFGNGPANLTINGGRYTYSNAVAPVVADLVAFNYDQGAYGVRNLSMVNVGSTVIPSNLQNAFAGRGDFNRFCRIPINYRNQYTRKLSGTGTVITIPIVSQANSAQRHVIRLLGVNYASNSTAVRGTEATIDFASLTTISSISFWNSKNIASVAASGMNLQITLTSALTDPEIVIEPLSTNQKLIDLSNITIA